MQPVMARRRRQWAELNAQFPDFDPGANWQCWTGGPNSPDYHCPPAQPDLGAPEIQHCGYRNPGRTQVWTGILAGYGVGNAKAMHPEPEGYMSLKNLAEIESYAAETRAMLSADSHVLPGWASHFLSVARSHVGDVKHFVEYHQTQGNHAMNGYAAGYEHDGGGGGPYGYPQTYQAFGVFSPLRRRRAQRMMQEGVRPYGPYGGELIPGMGYAAGGNAGMSVGAPISMAQADAMQGVLSEHGYSAGMQAPKIRSQGGWRLAATRDMAPQIRTTYGGMPGVTSASARSANKVRRYNLYAASTRNAGMSVGAPISMAQADAMQGVLSEHGYSAGMQATGVRPRLNENWQHYDRAAGYPWTAASGGVFYGTQNPLRRAESMRENPSGFQNGFAVGGDGTSGCGCG